MYKPNFISHICPYWIPTFQIAIAVLRHATSPQWYSFRTSNCIFFLCFTNVSRFGHGNNTCIYSSIINMTRLSIFEYPLYHPRHHIKSSKEQKMQTAVIKQAYKYYTYMLVQIKSSHCNLNLSRYIEHRIQF